MIVFACAMLFGMMFAAGSAAAEEVVINATSFPDANFREYIKKNYDKNGDGSLSQTEIDAVSYIFIPELSISNLAGISHFRNLTTLYCYMNNISNIDISKNTKLSYLSCHTNKLTSLDVSNNLALTELHCSSNKLTKIDVSKNTELQRFSCRENKIASLDVSKNKKLTMLQCDGNLLTRLDLSNNTELTNLVCSYNFLSSLDLTNTKLINEDQYYCANCKTNYATSNGYINFSSLPGFVGSRVSNVQGAIKGSTAFILTGNTVTYDYDLGNGYTESFTINVNSITDVVPINSTYFPDAIFRGYVQQHFDLTGNGGLNQAELNQVTEINVGYMSVSRLSGVEYFKNLITLDCTWNSIESLDVSKNTKLENLWCSDNQLMTLDIRENTLLKTLWCQGNKLVSLDVSNNLKLKTLECDRNSRTITHKNGYVNYSALSGLDSTKVSNVTGADKGDTAFIVEMRKVSYSYDLGRGFSAQFTLNVSNAKEVEINATNFPDNNFRNYVKLNFDINGSGYFSQVELDKVTDIHVQGYSISKLKGIEYFRNLVELDCHDNGLKSIDIRKNTKLTYLDCQTNKLTNLDVSKNTKLVHLSCASNKLTNLDVSRNTKLTYLNCQTNELTDLDVSKNTQLTNLYCSDNRLKSLDIRKNAKLNCLTCYSNQLSKLDIDKNIKLIYLDCSYNDLTRLDISKHTKLTSLYCASNNLKKLNVSKNTKLTILDCSWNNLTSLDISKNTKLKKTGINCSNNTLTVSSKDGYLYYSSLSGFMSSKASNIQGALKGKKSFVLAGDTITYDYNLGKKGYTQSFTIQVSDVMDILSINSTNFPDKNFRKYVESEFDLTGNGALNQAEIDQITSIDVSGKSISDLTGIGFFKKLTALQCSNNSLSSLDVSKNTQLAHLNCEKNLLTSLNVSKNTKLISLECGGNRLTSLSLSKNKKLTTLDCLGNIFTVKPKDGKVLYSSLPGLVKSKVTNIQGAKKGKTAFLVEDGADEIKYDYNTGKGKRTFTLKLTGVERKTDTSTTEPGKLESVKLAKTKYAYTGKAMEPKVTVKGSRNGKTVTLKKGADYTVMYENNVNAGTATVMVKCKGNYTGTLTATFTIEPLKLKNATVKLNKTTVPYTGKALKPTVIAKITLNGKTVTLKAGTDYTVKYSNNMKPGTATATITGKGNFTGTMTLTFRIKK